MKKALITGISGQDGSYLADLLLSKGYEVHGIVRRTAIEDEKHKLVNITHLREKVVLHVGDLDNPLSIINIVREIMPDECYHLAASSFVSYSFEDEMSVFNNNVNSTYCLLAAIKDFAPQCRTYYAGSSEMFGRANICPQNENTPFNPRSIYGISKVTGFFLAKNYRESYNLFVCCGILYNHESPRRGFAFVTRKITSFATKIKLGIEKKLYLGNLDALRDWGYAPDYVDAMWRMLQMDEPDDYVIASGVTHSVRDFAVRAFECVGLDFRDYVECDPKFYRENEKVPLCGDASKAQLSLGWHNTRDFNSIIAEMVEYDLQLWKSGKL